MHYEHVDTGRHTSKYKGVSWSASSRKWRVQLGFSSKVHHLGFYVDEEEAARAYDRAVVALRGVATITNFPLTRREVTLARQAYSMRNLAALNPETRESAECLRVRIISAAALQPREMPAAAAKAKPKLGWRPEWQGVGLEAGESSLPNAIRHESAGRRRVRFKAPGSASAPKEVLPGEDGVQRDGLPPWGTKRLLHVTASRALRPEHRYGAATACKGEEQPPAHITLETRLEAAAAAALVARLTAAKATIQNRVSLQPGSGRHM